VAQSLTRRSARESGLWVPVVLGLALASAQASQPPANQAVEEPVIRASELKLKEPTTIAAVSGVVRLTRNGDTLNPAVGAAIEVGDLVQIEANSSLTLRSARGMVTLTNKEGEWFKFVR